MAAEDHQPVAQQIERAGMDPKTLKGAKPIVAALPGTALGIGLELPLSCHRIIAADKDNGRLLVMAKTEQKAAKEGDAAPPPAWQQVESLKQRAYETAARDLTAAYSASAAAR